MSNTQVENKVENNWDKFFITVALKGDNATVHYGIRYRGGIPEGKDSGISLNETSPQALYNRLMQETHAAFAHLKNDLSWSILNERKTDPTQTSLKFKKRDI